jgi:hypothetical protein
MLVAAPDDATLAYWSEQRSQLRQSETQLCGNAPPVIRSNMMTLVR